MTRDDRSYFTFFRILIDGLIIFSIWMTSYYIRFESFIPGAQSGLFLTFFSLAFPVTFLFLYLFYRQGIYKSLRFQRELSEFWLLFKTIILGLTLIVVAIYFLGKERLSRLALIQFYFMLNFSLFFVHLFIRRYWRNHLIAKERKIEILLVGKGTGISEFIKKIKSNKDAGFKIAGWYDLGPANKDIAKKYGISEFTYNDDSTGEKLLDDLEEAIKLKKIDEIVVSYQGKDGHIIDKILKKCANYFVTITVIPDLSLALVGHQITTIEGLPIIVYNLPQTTIIEYFMKRVFDFLIAFIALFFLSPLLILIAILIKWSSKGPIFYGQERIGLDGRNFKMWKFRSMKIDAEKESGAVWAIKDDPRRTSFGTFLRSTSLDELPQLWNVLKGEMSLVGPRPERPIFVEKFKDEVPNYMLRHKMKSGITGWAQINGWRGNTPLEGRIECDLYYIRHWSLWFDLKILFLTVWKGLNDKNAY